MKTSRFVFILAGFYTLYILFVTFNWKSDFLDEINSFSLNDHHNPGLPYTVDIGSTLRHSYYVFLCFMTFVSYGFYFSVLKRRYGFSEFKRFFNTFISTLIFSACLIVMVGVVMRIEQVDKLLWIREPLWNRNFSAVFGPFAYRSNAAQYINCVWPLCIPVLVSSRSLSKKIYPLVLVGFPLLVFGVYFTGSRLSFAAMSAGLSVMVYFLIRSKVKPVFSIIFFFIISAFAATLIISPDSILLGRLSLDSSGRIEIFQNSLKIINDHLLFGSGPGSFAAIYFAYKSPDQVWHAYLHSDILQLVLEHGIIAGFLIILLLILELTRVAEHISRSGNKYYSMTGLIILIVFLVQVFLDFPLCCFSVVGTIIIIVCSLSQLDNDLVNE